jgi:phosphoserine phosphatase RsbU/P
MSGFALHIIRLLKQNSAHEGRPQRLDDMDMISDKGKVVGRSRKESLSRVAFWAIIIPSLAVSAICLIAAIQWINKPFPGFLVNERMMVAPIGQYHWTGTRVGLKYPDKILKANGTSVSTLRELRDILDPVKVGDSILYLVERDGKAFEVAVEKMRFSVEDLLMTFGTTFFAGVTYLLIGLIVFIMKPGTKVSWTFLVACVFLSLWSITIFDMQATHYGFIRFYLLAASVFPAVFIHFSFYFPETQKLVLKHPRIQILPYVIALAIIVPMEMIYPSKSTGLFYAIAQLYMFGAALVLLYSVSMSYFRPPSVLAMQRAKVVLLGALIAFPIPTIAYFSQLLYGAFLGIRIQTNFLMFPMIIFPASIAYAVARHNLFDVDVYIKRAVGYVILTAIIAGAYAILSISFNLLIGQYEIAQSRAFPILFTFGVILVFNPLRDRIQAFVDRVFFRKEYDYSQVIEKIGGAITTLMDLGQVLRQLLDAFMKDLFIDTSSIMLLDPASAGYRVYLADGEKKAEVERALLKQAQPLAKILETEKRDLTKYDILEDPKYKQVREVCTVDFETLHASLLVPMVFQDRVIGVISLGDKKSGRFFNRDDIDLLHTIANQGAVAIENARLFQENLEKQRMEEELNIARDLQISMLPAACPKIEGFDIAAISTPAREVGGDFFDFIEMGEGKIGLVIGDVTGKSVSGALVMSSSRSVFRMLSEQDLGVGEIMIRANRRMKKDIKSGMFVALLYAVLDSKEKTVSLCSAGQTQPVHCSATCDKPILVQTEGDSFPIGILEDAEYTGTRLNLGPGDRLVFYTDGIVEATNEQGDLFGFDRLLNVVNEARSLKADLLLKEILDKVEAFVGAAPQHDDLTAIVISVYDLNK